MSKFSDNSGTSPAGAVAVESIQRRRGPVFWIRLTIGLFTLLGLGWAARNAVRQLLENPPDWSAMDYRLLGLAIVAMGMSQMLAGLFWRQVLAGFGHRVPLPTALTAFFCSQIGKYFPGKALVVVIRTGMVCHTGVPLQPAVRSVFVETLMWIAVGALVGLSALALTGAGTWWMNALAMGMAMCAGMVTMPPVFGRVSEKLLRMMKKKSVGRLAPGWSMWMGGIVLLTVAWVIAGSAMMLVLNAVGPQACRWSDLPICVAAVSLATVTGFVTLIPGGLGVRELVILPLVASVFPARQALVAAILFRLVTMAAELLMTAIMYAVKRIAERLHEPGPHH